MADARSPNARGWIEHLGKRPDFDLDLISLFPADPLPNVRLHVMPLLTVSRIGSLGQASVRPKVSEKSHHKGTSGRLRQAWWAYFAPICVGLKRSRLRQLLREVDPDLIHAMRIPVEGEAVGLARGSVPLIVSTWGNDFTLWSKFPLHRLLTKHVLARTDLLLCDSDRDIDLARGLGYPAERPAYNLPVAGGVDTRVFFAGQDRVLRSELGVQPDTMFILNPRGLRPYFRSDTFLAAASVVAQARPNLVFGWAGLAPEQIAEAKDLVARSGTQNVLLLEQRSHESVARLFRIANIVVSPSEHDGIPNTLLEAMACGCFPIASDLPSIREWVTHGRNGLLFDPHVPEQLINALLTALDGAELRQRAGQLNQTMILERASRDAVMAQAEAFYRSLIARSESGLSADSS